MVNKAELGQRDPLPENFDTLEEFWTFWDTHSSADYEDMLEPVEAVYASQRSNEDERGMIETRIEELAVKIDRMQAAITGLEARVAELGARQPGVIRTDHAHIVRVQGVCGGRPVIEGSRLSVKLIVGWARMGMTVEEIAAQYPHVSVVQVADALAYYEDHPEEIEAEFAEEQRYIEIEIPRLQAMIAQRHPQRN